MVGPIENAPAMPKYFCTLTAIRPYILKTLQAMIIFSHLAGSSAARTKQTQIKSRKRVYVVGPQTFFDKRDFRRKTD